MGQVINKPSEEIVAYIFNEINNIIENEYVSEQQLSDFELLKDTLDQSLFETDDSYLLYYPSNLLIGEDKFDDTLHLVLNNNADEIVYENSPDIYRWCGYSFNDTLRMIYDKFSKMRYNKVLSSYNCLLLRIKK